MNGVNRPGDEYIALAVKGFIPPWKIVRLTPEARLAWRLSGQAPLPSDLLDAEIVGWIDDRGTQYRKEDQEAVLRRLAQLNGRAP